MAAATAPTLKNKQPAAAGKSINLKIKGLEDGQMLIFKTEKGIQLKKLMSTYSHWVSVDINENRFFFGSRQITVEETPDSLGMEDGDVIHALRSQLGAVLPNSSDTNTGNLNVARVKFSVRDYLTRPEGTAYYSFERDTKMRTVMELYCSRMNSDMDRTILCLGFRIIRPNDTPDTLGLKNGDVICAYLS